MPPESKVDLYAAIRRDARAGMSKRELQRKHNVGFATVQRALDSAWPEPRKKYPRRASLLDPHRPFIDQILRADLDAPRKQRHTAKRIFDRLVAEQDAVEVSYSMVRGYVAERRREIWAEAGRGPSRAFVPQSHRPGAEAEVGFGDVTIRLGGQQVKACLFAFRMSYSGKAVHRPIDRTKRSFLADQPRPQGGKGQGSFSLVARTEQRWLSTRRLASGMSPGCGCLRSGWFGRPRIRCCRGWCWMKARILNPTPDQPKHSGGDGHLARRSTLWT